MAGLGGPGLGGGFGKGKSIGSKVGKALGGHLSKAGKLGGGGKKGFNFSFKNFFNAFKPGYAKNMGQLTGKLNQLNKPSAWKVKQFADKNIDITKMNKSFLVNINTQAAINKIKNEKVKNWLNKHTPKSVKDLKINHQMYSPTKIKPTDPNYNQTGTGSIQLDPDVEQYLDWMASQNPTGMTISDAKKLYANNLKDGKHTLQQVMKMNPANTIPFYALIDDTDESTPTKNDSLKVNNTKENNNMVMNAAALTAGASAAPGFVKTTAQNQPKSTKSLEDYISLAKLYMLNNSDTDDPQGIWNSIKATEMGGLNPITHSNWDPSNFNLAKARAFADNSHLKGGGGGVMAIRNALGLLGSSDPTGLDDHDLWELYQKGFGSIPAGIKNPYTKTAAATDKAGDKTGTDNTTTTTPTGLTQADLDKWWKGIDKTGWGSKTTTTNNTQGMGDFMKFMMFMSMMQPQKSGGGSQYGYGGLNPGGVMSSYNPLSNISQLVSSFNTLPGIGGSTSGTSGTSGSST